MNLTDNEVIKALEYLVKNANNHIPITGKMLLEDVLDVLNRKDAEVERLRDLVIEGGREQDRLMAEIERLSIENYRLKNTPLNDFIDPAKSEAIKEFAERLKEKIPYIVSHLGNISVMTVHRRIDNLVKEMTEGSGE